MDEQVRPLNVIPLGDAVQFQLSVNAGRRGDNPSQRKVSVVSVREIIF